MLKKDVSNPKLMWIYLLFICVIVAWALSWPVSTIGLRSIPPLWFATLRLGIASVCLFIITLATGVFKIPSWRDMPLVLSIGLLQMGFFLMCVNIGLQYVAPGRSAILVYTTPIWVTPVAVLFFKERLPWLKLLGLLAGFVGILILFNPARFNWHNPNVVFGNGILLLAALAWAICMLHTRYAKWHSSSLQLAPWQCLVACLLVLMFSLHYEPHSTIQWTHSGIAALAYNSLFATAFTYLGIVIVGRALPVITTALLLLGVPALGLVFSMILVGERLTLNLLCALIFILGGLACVTLSDRKNRDNKKHSDERLLKAAE